MRENGVLHRDISLGNIVITYDGHGCLIDLDYAKKLVVSTTEPAAVAVKDAKWYSKFEDWYKQYSGHPNYLENPHFTRDAALKIREECDDAESASNFVKALKTDFPDLLALKRPASLIFLLGGSLANVLRSLR